MSILPGIRHFAEHFSAFSNQYVLIGGAACHVWYADEEPAFRATQDMDIVLVLEQLDDDFVHAFKQYLLANGYQQWERHLINQADSHKKVMYRFIKPANSQAPAQLELLSRKGNIASLDAECHTAPVKAGEVYTGLSCIVLDDAYYHFLISQARDKEKLSILSIPALILLKIKAYLNLREQYNPDKPHGSDGGKRNIRKHRNDVFFMLFSLEGDITCALSETLMSDVQLFIDFINADETAWQGVLTHLKHQYGETSLQGISRTSILARLKEIFQLL